MKSVTSAGYLQFKKGEIIMINGVLHKVVDSVNKRTVTVRKLWWFGRFMFWLRGLIK